MNDASPNHEVPDPIMDALSSRLDALGRADRERASPGLEDRVMAGVGRVFAPDPVAFVPAEPRRWRIGTLRMAAGVALFATAGAVLLTLSGPAAGPGNGQAALVSTALVENRIEGLLALASEPSDGFGDAVASIELWADALSTESDASWIGSDLADPGWWDAGLSGGIGGAL